MRNFILILIILFVGNNKKLLAQSDNNSNSLLWYVSGNNLTKPVYIYGTIHQICTDLIYWPQIADSILLSVDKVYFEVDLSKMQRLYINDEKIQEADSFAMFNTKDSILKYMDKDEYCDNSISYEGFILNRINKAGIVSDGLESIGSQIFLLNKIYDVDYNKTIPEHVNLVTYEDMARAYINQNVELLYRYMYQTLSFEEGRLLLDNRNRNWILRFKQITKDKTVFIAVGAGHLGGNSGVINLLRKRGYTVRPVSY